MIFLQKDWLSLCTRNLKLVIHLLTLYVEPLWLVLLNKILFILLNYCKIEKLLEFYETRARCRLSLTLLYQPLYPGKGILKGLRIGRLYEDDFQSREVHMYKYKLLSAIDIL